MEAGEANEDRRTGHKVTQYACVETNLSEAMNNYKEKSMGLSHKIGTCTM